jgi:uncharacterized membrane protein YcaP (DUF421 family)
MVSEIHLLEDRVEKACDHRAMWSNTVSWWELILRGIIMYAVVLAMLRLTGKRQVGQLAPFDLVLLLLLSNSVQNAMNGGDNSVHGGIISAATLIVLNYLVGLATFRSKRMESLIEGRPQILIHDGKVDESVMRSAQMTHHELDSALRRGGCVCAAEVKLAVLETNGEVSVVQKVRDVAASQ